MVTLHFAFIWCKGKTSHVDVAVDPASVRDTHDEDQSDATHFSDSDGSSQSEVCNMSHSAFSSLSS